MMTKKYKIDITGQFFEFEDKQKAEEKAKELINAGLWWITLETIE